MTPVSAARCRTALASALLLLPLLWWGWTVFRSPDVELLPPGPGTWIVDPRWEIDKEAEALFPPTRFRRRFEAENRPGRPTLDVTALGRFRVALDGRVVADSSTLRSSWKRPVRIDLEGALAPDLSRHELLIEVSNPTGPSPLRVAGHGAMEAVGSGTPGWEASTRGLPWVPAARAGRGEEHFQRKGSPWGTASHYSLLLAALVCLVVVGLLRRPRPRGVQGDETPPSSRLRRHGPVVAVLVVVIAAHAWNAWHFPFRRSGLDWGGHTEHIRYSATTVRPALAEEGWQMYQPPLYYWLAGAVYRVAGGTGFGRPGDGAALRQVQRLGALVGAAHALLVLLMLWRFGPPHPRARAWALAWVGLAPAALTTGAMITNEPFSGLMAALPIALAAVWIAGGRLGLARGAALGALAGLALLAKFTGLMPTAAAVGALGLGAVCRRAGSGRRRRIGALAGLTLVAVVLAGPYYLRNVQVYGKPFPGNWDPATGQSYVQEPGYRTLSFLTTFGDVFFHLPERARWSSLWDGLYGSYWGEIHGNFLRPDDPRAVRGMLWIFALAIVPTGAGLYGLAVSSRRAVAPRKDEEPEADADLLFVLVTVFSVAAVALFTVKVPFLSTVKAFFLLHLSIPAALFIARGYARLERGLGKAGWLLDFAALIQIALVLRLFLWR